MGKPTSFPSQRISQRLRLSHVQQRSNERLRERWQRRLDSGEEVFCWQCRLWGTLTSIDPGHWHLRDDTRAPECAACHAQDQAIPRCHLT